MGNNYMVCEKAETNFVIVCNLINFLYHPFFVILRFYKSTLEVIRIYFTHKNNGAFLAQNILLF